MVQYEKDVNLIVFHFVSGRICLFRYGTCCGGDRAFSQSIGADGSGVVLSVLYAGDTVDLYCAFVWLSG